MIDTLKLAYYECIDDRSSKYWAAYIDGDTLWAFHGALAPHLNGYKTFNVWSKTFQRNKVVDQLDKKVKEKFSKGYEKKDIPDWFPLKQAEKSMKDKMLSTYAINFRVNKAGKGIPLSAIKSAYENMSVVMNTLQKENLISKYSDSFDEDGSITVRAEDQSLSFGIVPDDLWNDLSEKIKLEYISRKRGVRTFLNPDGFGRISLTTKGGDSDLAVRLFIYQLASFGSIMDTYRQQYDKNLFTFQQAKHCSWYTHKQRIVELLSEVGIVQSAHCRKKNILKSKATSMTGMLAIG